MASRLFALVIGIDKYKSGNIWDLQTSVDDANSIKHFLTHDLHVPRDQICMLLGKQATKHNIEQSFSDHLTNNPTIEHGDAILIYFAGHGSSIRAPRGWYGDGSKDVEVLCTFDYDTKWSEGRVAGISDRSLHAMIGELCRLKGDNITLILDCCFSPPSSRVALRERRHTRWTPTTKATPNDLLSCLWKSPTTPAPSTPTRGFARIGADTHIVLAACKNGECATEGKAGGNFTQALLHTKNAIPLHTLTYVELTRQMSGILEEDQHPVCVGKQKDRILFDGLPFYPDARYVSIGSYDEEKLRVDAGAIHGIAEGTEFSIHRHNRRGSLNPILATLSVVEVHPTWCIARNKSATRTKPAIREGWARVTRWNNRTPFRVHLRKSFFSFFRRFRLRREIPSRSATPDSTNPPKTNVNMLRVRSASQSDVAVQLRRREIVLERQDDVIAANCRRIIHLSSDRTSSDLKVLDAAAHFHLHLHRKNPQRPLRGLVTMELYRLDSGTWDRISGNLLVDGRAQITDDEKHSIYAVVLHNNSDTDLYPYLAYMDSSGYGISMVYHPDAASHVAPLRKHSHMVIGEFHKILPSAVSHFRRCRRFYCNGFRSTLLQSPPWCRHRCRIPQTLCIIRIYPYDVH